VVQTVTTEFTVLAKSVIKLEETADIEGNLSNFTLAEENNGFHVPENGGLKTVDPLSGGMVASTVKTSSDKIHPPSPSLHPDVLVAIFALNIELPGAALYGSWVIILSPEL
jgi:hypothetical protein